MVSTSFNFNFAKGVNTQFSKEIRNNDKKVGYDEIQSICNARRKSLFTMYELEDNTYQLIEFLFGNQTK